MMVTFATEPAAVRGLGSDIVAMASDVDRATAAVGALGALGATASLDGPPRTAAALADFAEAYGQTTERLRDDVVALGRLTQAVGAEYDAVETAAFRLYLANEYDLGDQAGASDG
jgi:hypothetical protein